MNQVELLNILKKFVPAGTEILCSKILIYYGIHLHISKPRKSKYGDYRPPVYGQKHRISLNNDLNEYAFLITFLHETAHLTNFMKNGLFVMPHGTEWKNEFKRVSTPFIDMNVMPSDVIYALKNYLSNPAASSCSDPLLFKTLRKYDKETNWMLVEEIPPQVPFVLQDGREFIKIEKHKTRFSCIEVISGKKFIIPGLMQCKPKIVRLNE